MRVWGHGWGHEGTLEGMGDMEGVRDTGDMEAWVGGDTGTWGDTRETRRAWGHGFGTRGWEDGHTEAWEGTWGSWGGMGLGGGTQEA